MGKLTIVKKRKKFAGPHLVHRSELTPMILPNSTAVECVGWERERETRPLCNGTIKPRYRARVKMN